MDTDALRWFQQVADGTTVTEVSDLEGLTQSGVSRALARLDAEIGTPLLRRHGRVLRMTQAGAAFKRHVDALLHELDDGLAEVAAQLAPETGKVSISFQGSLGAWFVPGLVASFRRAYPDVGFDLRQVRDELVNPILLGGSADLEITTTPPTDPDVTWQPLRTEPLCLAVSTRHALADTEQTELSALSGEPFVTLRETYELRRLTERLCREAGFAPLIAFEGDDVQTVLGLVAADQGVALVPDGQLAGVPNPDLRYLAVSDRGAQRSIGVAWSRERRLLPSAELFRRHVLDQGPHIGRVVG